MSLKLVLPLKLGGVGFLFLGWFACPAAGQGVPVVFVIAGLVLLLAGMLCSRCPYCGGYLSHKRNWIGKYCVHCGKKIEANGARPDDSGDWHVRGGRP